MQTKAFEPLRNPVQNQGRNLLLTDILTLSGRPHFALNSIRIGWLDGFSLL